MSLMRASSSVMVTPMMVGSYFPLAQLCIISVPVGCPPLGLVVFLVRSASVTLRVGRPAIANRLHIGEVERFQSPTFIYKLEGRKTNTVCSSLRVKNAHHEGRNYYAPGCIYNPPRPRHVRIVYLDICKLKRCSVDSDAFHSFAWPRNAREAKGIARTLFTNHCNWADVLIVRGRCFSSSNKFGFRANRVLENLLWN